jgi:hypothetical protein
MSCMTRWTIQKGNLTNGWKRKFLGPHWPHASLRNEYINTCNKIWCKITPNIHCPCIPHPTLKKKEEKKRSKKHTLPQKGGFLQASANNSYTNGHTNDEHTKRTKQNLKLVTVMILFNVSIRKDFLPQCWESYSGYLAESIYQLSLDLTMKPQKSLLCLTDPKLLVAYNHNIYQRNLIPEIIMKLPA